MISILKPFVGKKTVNVFFLVTLRSPKCFYDYVVNIYTGLFDKIVWYGRQEDNVRKKCAIILFVFENLEGKS